MRPQVAVEEAKEEVKEEPAVVQPNQGRQELLDLMEKVEGGREVIQLQTRFVLYHGDLVEMDVADNSAMHRVHGYLCNDRWEIDRTHLTWSLYKTLYLQPLHYTLYLQPVY